MIGIKLADGSFYPVLDEGVPKTKKLTLTTARDNQDTAHIVLVRGEPGAKGGGLAFIRELFLSGLGPAPCGAPDIELVLSLDENLVLQARLNLPGLPAESPVRPGWTYEAPRGPKGRVKTRRGRAGDFGVALKYWESDTPTSMSGEEFAATGVWVRPNAVSLAAFVLLGLFVCAVLAFVFYQVFRAPPQPPLARALFLLPCFGRPGTKRRE
ncbi:MAG: hypothetical protein LBT33_10170 [Spirochaetia bacterium]|jgi:hypothetical protein|nr:hypothetical protein [Spirochaetia bacterium]